MTFNPDNPNEHEEYKEEQKKKYSREEWGYAMWLLDLERGK